jgi:serine protease Do
MKWKGLILLMGLVLACVGCAGRSPDGSAAQGLNALQETQHAFRAISGDVLPSVVEVNVAEITRQPVPESRGWPWNFMFPDSENGEGEREFRTQGLGSGFIIGRDSDTYLVVTNNHVVGNADEISIRSYDDKYFPAICIGKDERSDLALLTFESPERNFEVAHIGDSDTLMVGDWVLAFGSPLSLEFSVTAGIVSALHRSGPTAISDYIQTDAAINQGNSGGPLVNLDGSVVGVNTWITTPTGGNVGLGFAIPINNVVRVVDDLREFGKVRYGWLGVSIKDPYDPLQTAMGLEGLRGAMVFHVYRESPAAEGGVKPGDFILAVNGRDVGDADRLIMLVGTLMPERKADFVILRKGERIRLTVEMGVREDNTIIADRSSSLWPGFEVIPLSEEIRSRLEIDPKIEGLAVVQVIDRTGVDEAGLRQLDVIQAINEKAVTGVVDFYTLMNDPEIGTYSLSVLRNGSTMTIHVTK